MKNPGLRLFCIWVASGCALPSTHADILAPSLVLAHEIAPWPLLGWTNAGAPVALEFSDTLDATALWQTTPQAPEFYRDQYWLWLDRSGPARFFRLRSLTAGAAMPQLTIGQFFWSLSWRFPTPDFVVETTDGLGPTNVWLALPYLPKQAGDLFSVGVNPVESQRFFRLRALPGDPAAQAPPLAPGIVTDWGLATAFLYSGPNPTQSGVTNGAITPVRAALLRGQVNQRTGNPLPDVTISVLNHPEFGRTRTRSSGQFDLAVNGGGPLTVQFEKAGFLPSQRQAQVPWQDAATLPNVVLLAADPRATPVALATNTPAQVARGSVQTDEDGPRQATVILPPGVQASLVFPDGSTQAMNSLTLRATEYTVGANGPAAMPAELPPTSFYTYCVELSADEAGAATVQFDQPVAFYVDNFLNLPVGLAVPVAYYDKPSAAWVPTDDGRVIRLLSIVTGRAELDVNGSGQPADAPTLASLGITDAERVKLANLYAPGVSLWRAQVTHFTPYDLNLPVAPPLDARAPDSPPPQRDHQTDPSQTRTQEGYGRLELQEQVFHESARVVGTPFTLHYASDRVAGRTAANTLVIPLSGTNLPASLKRIEVEIHVAGAAFTNRYPAQTNLSHVFVWDGKDVYGRAMAAAQPVRARIGYVYDYYYAVPAAGPRSFGLPSGQRIPGNIPARRELTLWQEQTATVGAWQARGLGLGGWTLSIHHTYDPIGRVLYYGDGRRRNARRFDRVITTVAGTGRSGGYFLTGDGGPATQATLNYTKCLLVSPDGSLYFNSETSNVEKVRRVGPDGIINLLSIGVGKPLVDLSLGPDGSLYLVNAGDQWTAGTVYRQRPGGLVLPFAGQSSSPSFAGDGGRAKDAVFRTVAKAKPAPDGSVYVLDQGNHCVRRISPDGINRTVAGSYGIIQTVAGTPTAAGFSGDGGPAALAKLNTPTALALGADGSLYIADMLNRRIRRVGPDGIITTVAGTGTRGHSGDGGPATQAQIDTALDLALDREGNLYIAERGSLNIVGYPGGWVRCVSSDGIITTLAGTGQKGPVGDGGPALQASFAEPRAIAVGSDGSIFVGDISDYRIRRIAPPLPGFDQSDIAIPSEDGSRLHRFSANGRHLLTLNALTGATLYQFSYDTNGLLAQVIDGDGNLTRLERGLSNHLAAVVAPFGQRTLAELNAEGYLVGIVNPAEETNRFAYGTGGLLAAVVGPKGETYTITYDSDGRAIRAADPAGGYSALARSNLANGYVVSQITAEGRVSQYQVETLTNGQQRLLETLTDGTQSETTLGLDGGRTNRFPSGGLVSSLDAPDPRFGMLAPFIQRSTPQTPGGLSATNLAERGLQLSSLTNPLSLVSFTNQVSVNGRIWTAIYASSNQTLTTTSPAGRQASVRMDSLGRMLEARMPGLEPSAFTYDSSGHLIIVSRGSTGEVRTTKLAYNDRGYLSAVTNALSQVFQNTYDDAGRVTAMISSDGGTAAFTHDANGNVTAVSPPGRPAHAFAFTSVNLARDYTSPAVDGMTNRTVFDYNADRQLTNVLAPDGTAVRYHYDGAGRLSRVAAPEVQMDYDYEPGTGRLASIVSSDGTRLAFRYDGALLLDEIWSGIVTGSVSRAYDNSFRLAAFTVNATNQFTYSYDADGLLTNAGALLLTRDPQTGFIIGTALGQATDGWQFNGFGEPVSYVARFGAKDLLSVAYRRDALERLVEKIETIGGTSVTNGYAYDLAGRLAQVTSNGAPLATYTYDSNGNRLSRVGPAGVQTASYDDQDRLRTNGTATYAYSANGQLTNKSTGAQSTQYSYDSLGQLSSAILPSGARIEHLTDARQRRIGKKTNGVLVQSLLYRDGLRPIAGLDGTNRTVSLFVYGSRANVPDYLIKGGVNYRVFSDHLGSPRLVVNTQTGEIVQRLDYDEFGQVLLDTQPGFQPFGFAGGLYDGDTGLVHFGARDYDPDTGRWTQRDPLLFASASLNLYEYVNNDPVNGADPTGFGPQVAKASFAGKPQIQFGGQGPWSELTEATPIHQGDLIKTGPNDLVTVNFLIGGRSEWTRTQPCRSPDEER